MSRIFFVAGAVPFALLGLAHLVSTLRDVGRPAQFVPVDASLVRLLEQTMVKATASGPGAHSMWRTWLGANLTHSLGLIAFSLILVVIALHDYAIVSELTFLPVIATAVGAAYTVVGFRFWFVPAGVGAAIGTVCFAASLMI